MTERIIALKLHKNHFCFIWKTNGNSFNKAIEELGSNFKIVHNVISDKHVESSIKHEYKPEKIKSQLTNMTVYDLETFNTAKFVPYANCIIRLNKRSGKYKREIVEREYEKCRKDCYVFKGTDSYEETLDLVLQFKGEPKEIKNEIVKYNLYISTQNSSGFDNYVVL